MGNSSEKSISDLNPPISTTSPTKPERMDLLPSTTISTQGLQTHHCHYTNGSPSQKVRQKITRYAHGSESRKRIPFERTVLTGEGSRSDLDSQLGIRTEGDYHHRKWTPDHLVIESIADSSMYTDVKLEKARCQVLFYFARRS